MTCMKLNFIGMELFFQPYSFFLFLWKFEELEIPPHLGCMFSCLCYLKGFNINALVPLCKGRVFEYVNIFKPIIHGSCFGVIHLSEVWICGITFLERACSSGFMYIRMDMNFLLLSYTKHCVKLCIMLPWQSQCNVLLYLSHPKLHHSPSDCSHFLSNSIYLIYYNN